MVSQEVVEKILGLRRQGYSIREIARRVGLSHSTVWRILKRVEEEQAKSHETSKTSRDTSGNGAATVLNSIQALVHGLAEHVKAIENSVLNLSQDVESLKTFRMVLEQVARLRVEGPTRCKYIDDYGYCTRILLPECLPGTKCLEVILGDGTKMYRPRVVDSPIICLACPHYKPKKLI